MKRRYIKKEPDEIRYMFDLISNRYNLMNSLMTFGYDRFWRRTLIDKISLPDKGRVLDIGTGTGDIPLEILSCQNEVICVGADFSENMLKVARTRKNANRVCWLATDSLSLSFRTNSFDVVTSAFLMRNVVSLRLALKEQYRVLTEGGCLLCLDTSPFQKTWLKPILNLYFFGVIPLLGQLISGHGAAYKYFSESTAGFLPAEDLAQLIASVGFRNVGFSHAMLGSIAFHWGIK